MATSRRFNAAEARTLILADNNSSDEEEFNEFSDVSRSMLGQTSETMDVESYFSKPGHCHICPRSSDKKTNLKCAKGSKSSCKQ